MLKLSYLYFTIIMVILIMLPLNAASSQSQKPEVDGELIEFPTKVVGKRIKLPTKKASVPNVLAKKLLKEMVKTGYELSEQMKEDYQQGLSFFAGQEIDLNNDGKMELVVRQSGNNPICRGHNCPIWIFNKKGKSYQLLLNDFINNFELITLKNKHHGYYDLLLITHTSGIEQELTIYQFSGVKYRIKKCITETAKSDTEDNTHQYKEHSCY